MRKRLVSVVLSVTAAAVLLPAAPASATTCILLPDPDIGDVYCLVFSEPAVQAVCAKVRVC